MNDCKKNSSFSGFFLLQLIFKIEKNFFFWNPRLILLILSPVQQAVQVRDVNVRDTKSRVCLFRPDTSYTIRLRHRYLGPESPWSSWSNPLDGRTAPDGEQKQRSKCYWLLKLECATTINVITRGLNANLFVLEWKMCHLLNHMQLLQHL